MNILFYLGWFLFLFGKKPTDFAAKTFFWSSHTFGPKPRSCCSEDLFFGLSPVFGSKKVPPRNPARGATISSYALALEVEVSYIASCNILAVNNDPLEDLPEEIFVLQ